MKAPGGVLFCVCALLLLAAVAAGPQVAAAGGLSHQVCGNCHVVAPSTDHENCVGCHRKSYTQIDGLRELPQDVVAEFQRQVHHPLDTGNPNSTCAACHDTSRVDPEGTPYSRLLRSANQSGTCSYFGNQFCYSCHQQGSDLPQMALPRFEQSAHNDVRLDPSSGTQVKCSTCHEAHGAGFPDLAKAPEESLCYGSDGTCHSSADNSARGIAVQQRFTASTDTFAHHNMTSEDQRLVAQVVEKDPNLTRPWPVVGPSKLECSSCHNAHLNNAQAKTVDPYDRAALDVGQAVDPLTIVNKALGKTTNFGPKLTDGQIRATSVSINIPFGGETVDMVVDLGSTTSVNKMIAYVMHPLEGPHVSSVTFSTSVDGLFYIPWGVANDANGGPTRPFSLKLAGAGAIARFVKYSIYRPYIEPADEQYYINQYAVGELEAFDTSSGVQERDVSNNCLGCHSGSLPTGVLMSEKTRFWLATANSTNRIVAGVRPLDWSNEFHGGKDSMGGTVNSNDTLKAPYKRGAEPLQCTVCHDEHGSSNVYHLRETVNGKAGISVKSFRGKDAVEFCKACHNVHLWYGPRHCNGCHTTAVGCFDCHYHGRATTKHGQAAGL